MWHPKNKATLYSVKLQKFACAECNSRPDFAEQKALFEPIGDTVRQLRTQAKRMVKYSQDILAKLNVSLGNISANNAELGPAVQQTQTLIQEKFTEIVTIIQEREQTLMKHVQTEVWLCVCVCVCVYVHAVYVHAVYVNRVHSYVPKTLTLSVVACSVL